MERYLENVLRRDHPSRKKVQVHNLTEIEGGWETSVYSFELTYQDTGGPVSEKLVLKVHPGPLGASQAAGEYYVMRAISDRGVRVPAVVLQVDDAPGFGGSIVIMERVAGRDLKSALSTSLDLIPGMARQLVRLHQLSPQVVSEETGVLVARDGFVAPDPAALEDAVHRFGLTDFRSLLQWFNGTSPTTVAPSVLHNDFHPENIIVPHGGSGLVIIDWSHAGIGDPRTDLAWSAFWTGVMSGRRARSELVTAYGELSGGEIPDLEYFEALTLGARLLTIATWLQGSVEPPVPKITREAIRGQYKPTVLTVYHRLEAITGVRIPELERL